ncbi:protein arginine kinase [Faecalispora anaeroviscerum]|uniref:protein arginine kinase n=1 Tax=Faecalispora anaeroviscerum TaxID=2991836 RepID=UPI0024BA42A8|nr:protein arginine kinase [Faecalispora anaeroviscerum]
MKKWYEKSGQEADVVISTRVRLARNLSKYPFPVKMSAEQREKVEEAVRDAVMRGNSSISSSFRFISLDDISQNEAVSLVERHLVSPEFISAPNGRGLLLTQDETISIMINEEDHLRIQVMREGLDLEGAYEMVDRVDALLNESLHFAFDEELGYLTQCPTNLGTGMRASLMLHLPALQESGAMRRVASSLSKLGLVIRGIYGEGSEPVGAIYQLSNQVTLGLSEQAAVANLKSIAGQLIAQERTARAELVKTVEAQDQIFRSIGILKSARVLNSDEFMRLISYVRMGVATGLLTGISYDTISSLIVQIQPATMMLTKKMTTAERDALRASIVSQRLNLQ